MYTLIHKSDTHFLAREMPSLIISVICSEFFFKLGSFTLECLCFLGLWYVVSFLMDFFRSRWTSGNKDA
jgi:hypothetical protein